MAAKVLILVQCDSDHISTTLVSFPFWWRVLPHNSGECDQNHCDPHAPAFHFLSPFKPSLSLSLSLSLSVLSLSFLPFLCCFLFFCPCPCTPQSLPSISSFSFFPSCSTSAPGWSFSSSRLAALPLITMYSSLANKKRWWNWLHGSRALCGVGFSHEWRVRGRIEQEKYIKGQKHKGKENSRQRSLVRCGEKDD